MTGAASEARHVDALDYTNKVFRTFYSKAYIEMINKTPELLGWMHDALDKPWKNERRRLALDKLNTRPLVKFLREYQPELIVCTHFLPAEIISWLTAKERFNCPQAIVVTDFDAHAMWLCRHYARYFVALEETKVHLSKLGIPAEKITVSGIPVDPTFSEEKDKQAMRLKHGLAPDAVTILLSAGGFGVGPVEAIVRLLFELRHKAQVVALCGRSEDLRRRVEGLSKELAAHNPQVSVKALGFTREMDELMSASDILLVKPAACRLRKR